MAESRVLIEGMFPPGSTLPISGTVTALSTLMTAAVTTLSGVTSGTGTTVDFGSAQTNISMAILVNGTVVAGVVILDVSHDGTNWVQFANLTPVTNTNTKLTASTEAWRYARGRIGTPITGGATITATLMAGG